MLKRGKELVLKSLFQYNIRPLTNFDISLPGFLPKFEVTQTVLFLTLSREVGIIRYYGEGV